MRGMMIVICLLASSGFAGTFNETLDSLGTPTMGGDARTVQGFSFTYGNSTFTISGEAESVLAAGQTVGFAFSGSGSVKVKIQEGPFHQANLTTLADKVGWKGGGEYTETFDEAVFFTNEVPEGLLSGEHVTVVHLAEVVDKSIERWNETPYTKLDHILAEMVFNQFPGLSVSALLWGGDDDCVYLCDEVEDHNESFSKWKKYTRGGNVFQYLDSLIDQPAAFDLKRRPQPPVMQTDVDLEVVSKDNLFMTEKTTTEITSGRHGLRVVAFNLLNGRSKRFKDWDERDDPFVVKSVATSEGLALGYSHKYDELLVLLPQTLMAGQKLTLVIEAEGNFLKNYSGDAYLVLGNMAYFPQLGIFSMRAPFHSVVKVKDPYLPIGCGVNLRRWQEDGLNCLETREEMPMSFPFLVVGNFESAEKQQEGYDLKVYSYVVAKRRGAKSLLRNGLAILDFYSNGMEPFPYKELEVVEIPYYRHFFWQAPAGLVEITSEGLGPSADNSDLNTLISRYASKGQNARYAHEIAHQWFGNLVSWATPHDNWLSESFAEYLSYLFMAEGAKDKKKAKIQLREWKIDTQECSDKASVYGAGSLDGSPKIRACYTQLLYGKGPYVLHALRQEIGDEAFKKMFYFITTQAAKKDLKVITEDVILFVNALTGKDYHEWFDRYIYGTEIPKVKL